MKKVLLLVWGVCICAGAVVSGSNLEINIFNVGWGNFVLLKRDNNVLVIDCGKAKAFKESQARERLKDILRGSKCKVIITHEHKDHYSAANVLNDCFSTANANTKPRRSAKGQIRNVEFFYGWFSSDREEMQEGKVNFSPLPDDPSILTKWLGEDVFIDWIIPEANAEGGHPHINNLVIGIKYGNKSFIFPGAATKIGLVRAAKHWKG